MTITRKNICQVLINYIDGTGTTQVKIANESGLTTNTISLLVNGGTPHARTTRKLIRYFEKVGYPTDA